MYFVTNLQAQESLALHCKEDSTGHFRIAFCLCVKSFVRKLSYGNVFLLHVHFHSNQTHFHMKCFARRLSLNQRQDVSEMAFESIQICEHENTYPEKKTSPS